LNLGGRGRSFWNMSSGGSSAALAYEGAIGADGVLSGGSLQNTSKVSLIVKLVSTKNVGTETDHDL